MNSTAVDGLMQSLGMKSCSQPDWAPDWLPLHRGDEVVCLSW